VNSKSNLYWIPNESRNKDFKY